MTTLSTIHNNATTKTNFAATILDNFVSYIENTYRGRGGDTVQSFYLVEKISKDDNIDDSLKPVYNEIVLIMYKNGVSSTDGLYERLYLGPDCTYVETYKFVKKFNVKNVLTKEQVSLLDNIEEWYHVSNKIDDDELY